MPHSKRPTSSEFVCQVLCLSFLLFFIQVGWLSCVPAVLVNAQGVVVNANSCPFATLLSNLQSSSSATTNFTDLMIQNPSQFACDSLPNSAFDYYPDGVLFTGSAFTTVINIENTNRSFCGVDGGFGRERNLRICNDLFSNDTLAESLFLPYLESFRKNFTSFAGEKSEFSQVQTLQVLFGDFKKNYGENSVIPFFNRTIFAFCKNSNTQQFTALSQYACHDSYVVFWTPFASHLSFKIIELFLFFIQFVIGVLVVLIPLTQRNFLKWRNYFKYVNDRKLIEIQLERIKKIENTSNCVSSVPSSPNMETVPSSTSVTTGSPTSPTETPLNKTQQASSKHQNQKLF
ncbi:hypothetical protein C9374_004235 [Naegleria lovaniensis]|uniref:Transmembrane protein n=1 Tax=Naegleria lovaniensis TaxID=51637 RepID=A0AA88GM72_NAELO|nr:uncharacterized protein C9374_004235 [Naegleria lovaniensis]KAG2383564.1 hypothetical protein C9374_004235 [Naegleria lovaniensis]